MIEPPPRRAHAGHDRLGGEEMMPQIDILHVIPLLDGEAVERVAIIPGGVVDQHLDGSMRLGRFGDGVLERGDVGHVAGDEQRTAAIGRLQPVAERRRIGALHEGDLGPLRDEPLGQIFADPRSAARDEYGFPFDVVECGGEFHWLASQLLSSCD